MAQNQPINIQAWVTTADRTHLFEKQSDSIVLTVIGRDWGSTIIIGINQDVI